MTVLKVINLILRMEWEPCIHYTIFTLNTLTRTGAEILEWLVGNIAVVPSMYLLWRKFVKLYSIGILMYSCILAR